METKSIKNNKSNLLNAYRYIFILDSLEWFSSVEEKYDSTSDLILTYDFGLKKKILDLGGSVFYIDHIVDENDMNENNYIIYKFFKNWYLDKYDKDIFTYKDIPFGFSFRIEFWNDFTFYARVRLCLHLLKKIEVDTIFVASETSLITSILDQFDLAYSLVSQNHQKCQNSYFFPISKWMNEQIRPKGLRGFLYKAREITTAIYGYIMPQVDRIFNFSDKSTIFIQEYFPTRKILIELRRDRNIKVLLTNFSRGSKLFDHFFERLIPINGSINKFDSEAKVLISSFIMKRKTKLVLTNGDDISNDIYSIIEERLQNSMSKYLRTLDNMIRYVDKNPIDLEILIANIGHEATLLDCVCRERKIPSYLIINGLLLSPFDDESKLATMINSYSKSIKDKYFYKMDNIVCLGDPRMDAYTTNITFNTIKRKKPRITIGAAAFSTVDLNSYVAVEFDFMYDILCAFKKIISTGTEVDLVIKARSNGYKEQYENFINEYFSEMNIKIISMTLMQKVLENTDFYITTYSQTLFEASCLGIPVVYYKKDKEVLNPPFDNKSELVTISNVNDMIKAFYDFQNEHERYEAFLDPKIMEFLHASIHTMDIYLNLVF